MNEILENFQIEEEHDQGLALLDNVGEEASAGQKVPDVGGGGNSESQKMKRSIVQLKCEGTSVKGAKFKKPSAPSVRHTAAKLIKSCDIPVESEGTDGQCKKENEGTGNSEMRAKEPPLSYVEPTWSGKPGSGYSMEVLKSGVIIDRLSLTEKNYYLIGRLPSCDLSLGHPTISRHHAVLQYRSISDIDNSIGFYVYDLGSTHGTFWNGNRIKPYVYVRAHGGHMLKFGCSQRRYILQAPLEDHEAESEYTVTQLKERRQLELQTRLVSGQAPREDDESNGIDWGMGEDADEATDLQENPYASINDEDLVLDDPKKTLRGWFEREGYDLQYHTEERGIGQFLCWINLPLENVTGRSVRSEALVKGKKKESVVQCALEACKILDKYGLLRQANHEARKRKTRNWEEEDYYDSDEDNFLDRTGSVEKKREQRMRLAGKLENKVETHDSLLQKQEEIVKRISYLSNSLDNSQIENVADSETSADADALDAFMSKLSSCAMSKSDIAKMKLELQTLRKEQEKLVKLLDLTRPANLPPLSEGPTTSRLQVSAGTTCDVFKDRIHRKYDSPTICPAPQQLQQRTFREEKREPEQVEVDDPEDDQNREVAKDEDDERNEQESRDYIVGGLERNEKVEDELARIHPFKKFSQVLQCDRNPQKLEDMTKRCSNDLTADTQNSRQRIRRKISQSHKKVEKTSDEIVYVENYSTWVPPQDQQGDGKTKLNEKYGY